MSQSIDLFIIYQFMRRLVTPFNQWKAFELGIIDERGKVLRKRTTLLKAEEKNAWGWVDIMTANLKKIIETAPGGQTKLASYAAAMFLLREAPTYVGDESALDRLEAGLEEKDILEQFNASLTELTLALDEEVPANNAGQGAVAGIGQAIDGEPPVHTKTKYKKQNERESVQILTRVRKIIGTVGV